MTKDKVLIGGVVLALILSVVGLSQGPSTEIVREIQKQIPVGGVSGPYHTEHQVFDGNYTRGGTVVSTSSTATSFTMTAADLRRDVGYISWTPNSDLALTTMASTSAPFSQLETGEEMSVLFYNASTTAAATVTFAAGTGVDLQEDEGGTVIVNGLELARLTFVKKADSDVVFLVEPYQVGD